MKQSKGGGRRARGDGFSEESKRLFLLALRQGLSVLAACALVGISNRTAYNHRRDDPEFARDWALARRMYALPLELAAFERAVDGAKEQVYAYGKLSHVRTRPSDSLLIALLAAENPEKFGRTAGARAQGKLAKWIKRLGARLAKVEARLGSSDLRTVRNGEAVNFMNRPESRPRRVRKPAASRLATARRRASSGEISRFPVNS